MLQAPRTLEEVPGYEIPYLYFDYLRTGDARPLKGVFYHNAMDVVTLAALMSHTANMLADPFHEGIEHGLDVVAMAKLYEQLGEWETARRLFEKGLTMNLEEEHFWETLRRLAVLQKRGGNFEQAVPLWKQAAAEGHVYAYVELAKYYEHRSHDPKSALEWTKAAAKELKRADMLALRAEVLGRGAASATAAPGGEGEERVGRMAPPSLSNTLRDRQPPHLRLVCGPWQRQNNDGENREGEYAADGGQRRSESRASSRPAPSWVVLCRAR